jgi:hypothetical protein
MNMRNYLPAKNKKGRVRTALALFLLMCAGTETPAETWLRKRKADLEKILAKTEITSKYDEQYAELENVTGGLVNALDTKANMMTESRLQQYHNGWYVVSEDGAIGMTQTTKIAVLDLFRILFSYSMKSKLTEDEEQLFGGSKIRIGEYIRKIPRKHLEYAFWGVHKKKNRTYGEKVLAAVMHDVKFNSTVNNDIGSLIFGHRVLEARKFREEYNASRHWWQPKLNDEDLLLLPPAMYNWDVEKVKGAVLKYGPKHWRFHLPDETEIHLITFEIQRERIKRGETRAKQPRYLLVAKANKTILNQS